MWCGSSDTPHGPYNIPEPHHRIVRIPPGESVVLNSAERAAYLLLVEILYDDLDFDPSKRANKEVLKKIVAKESERKGASKDLVPFGRGKLKQHQEEQPPPPQATDDDDVTGNPNDPGAPQIPTLQVPPLSPSTVSPGGAFSSAETDNPEEEIDLVEQLYGSSQPLRSANLDLAESVVLPPAPKNRDLDMAAWSTSIPSTPNVDNPNLLPRGNQMARSYSNSGNEQTPNTNSPGVLGPLEHINGGQGVLSLDDYSERMRTAAIMLAQLNANLVRDQVVATASSDAPVPLSASVSRGTWIPGTGWLTGSSSAVNETTPPQHHLDHQTPTPSQSKMRLQYAQAQQIKDRIMKEMMALEEERMERMKENRGTDGGAGLRIDIGGSVRSGAKSAEDEGIIRRELNKADPSAVVFSESWTAKKVRFYSTHPAWVWW